REELYLAFDPLDQKVTQLLSDLQGFEKWNKALRMVAGRVQSALHDLHFAVSAGDGTPARTSQVIYRQTLVLLARTENLESLVRYVFDEQQSLKRWTGALGELRREIVALQKLQQKKAPRAELNKQLMRADQFWEKLVGQLKDFPGGQYVLLRDN